MASPKPTLSLLFLFIIFSSNLHFINAIYDCPMPVCETCIAVEVHDAPGVGFDLTTSYGTSAVHLLDGTVLNLAKVQAGPDYIELIRRLNRPPSTESNYSRFQRWLNKKLGRPASRDVGIISNLITELKKSTELSLSKSLDRVTVTTPLLQALTIEDLTDAIEYAGLRSWLIDPYPYPQRLSELSAVFAASGNGLCTRYRNTYDCEDETEEMPLHTVYFISYTRQALYTSLSDMDSAFGYYAAHPDAQLFDFDAGLDSLPSYRSTSEFWAHVRSQLRKLPEEAAAKPGFRPITKILLAGENVTDSDFLAALQDAMAQVSGSAFGAAMDGGDRQIDSSLSFDVAAIADPVFAAARGAAQVSRRRQESRTECVEREACDEWRRRERESEVERYQQPLKAELK